MSDVLYDGERLNIRLNKSNYKAILEIVKDCKDHEYIPTAGVMSIPPTKRIIGRLVSMGLSFDEHSQSLVNRIKKELDSLIDFSKLHPLELRKYQQEGVEWILKNKHSFLLGDEMGLGKTIQIASYLFFTNTYPALVICPASLKLNWEREIGIWAKKKCLVLDGLNPYPIEGLLNEYPVVIINYDILGRKDKNAVKEESSRAKTAKTMGLMYRKKRIAPTGWVDLLKQTSFQNIIMDEVQYIGEPNTARTIAAVDIAKSAKKARFVAVSGTPYTSATKQFFTILNLIAPKIFSNRWKYQMTFCDPKKGYFGWDFRGLSNGEALHNLIKPFMLRRLKADVLTELPPKVKSIVPMKVDKKLYDEYIVNENFLLTTKTKDKKKTYQELRRSAGLAKYDSCLSWIRDFLEVNDKLVVFVYYRDTFAKVMKEFQKTGVVGINGETPAKDRMKIVDQFQESKKIKLFVGQIEAAGVGLTLTAAAATAFVEFGDTASQHEQAEDRIHRIGQEASSIIAYYLIAPNTVDEPIVERVKIGYANQKSVLDGIEGAEFLSDTPADFADAILSDRRLRLQK